MWLNRITGSKGKRMNKKRTERKIRSEKERKKER
jgi:hypothetical protein